MLCLLLINVSSHVGLTSPAELDVEEISMTFQVGIPSRFGFFIFRRTEIFGCKLHVKEN